MGKSGCLLSLVLLCLLLANCVSLPCSALFVFSPLIYDCLCLAHFILGNRKQGKGQEKGEHCPDFNLERAKIATS